CALAAAVVAFGWQGRKRNPGPTPHDGVGGAPRKPPREAAGGRKAPSHTARAPAASIGALPERASEFLEAVCAMGTWVRRGCRDRAGADVQEATEGRLRV